MFYLLIFSNSIEYIDIMFLPRYFIASIFIASVKPTTYPFHMVCAALHMKHSLVISLETLIDVAPMYILTTG